MMTELNIQQDNSAILERLLPLLAQHVATADSTGSVSSQALDALRSSGCLGITIPEMYGGLGQNALHANRVVEHIAMVDASIAIIVFQHFAVSARILEWGTEDQCRRYLPLLASGRWIAASAWSESGAGANKQNIATEGQHCSDGSWLLNGAKTFTTGAGIADLYLVLAQTGERQPVSTSFGSPGQSFFLIEASLPGIHATDALDLVGMRGSSTGFLTLQQCQCAPDSLLGPSGTAAQIIARVRNSGLTLGAVSVGIAQAALDLALEQATKRGLTVHQATRFRLAELQMRVEAARSLVEMAGRRERSNVGAITLYSKIFASEASEFVCREAQQLMGGNGFLRTSPIERLARNARAIAFMGPVNDLARDLASQGLVNEL